MLPKPAVGNSSPFFMTISILDKSPKVSTTNPGVHFWRFVQNGDCRKKGTSCRRLPQTILENETAGRAASHDRTSTDSIRVSMCDIYFCISCQKKSPCIIAHRPIRFASRCAISTLYQLTQNHNMHHRTSTGSIRQSMCDICFVSLAKKSQHASSP